MKKILILSLSVTLLIVFSCKKKEVNTNQDGQIVFSFDSNVNSLKSANQTNLVTAAIIDIKDDNDNIVHENYRLDLYLMNGVYVSSPISLPIGDYKLTKFLIVDGSNTILYAAPSTGSDLALLINSPLPISFSVSKEDITQIKPEVLPADDYTAEDFGLISFPINIMEIKKFQLAVWELNSSTNELELTDALLNILVGNNLASSIDLLPAINTITIIDSSEFYTLEIKKNNTIFYRNTFHTDSLDLFNVNPLIISADIEYPIIGSVSDIEGNVYKTVEIGTQTWMAENLKSTYYSDGSPIPQIMDDNQNGSANDEWGNLDGYSDDKAYCWMNDDITNKDKYGALYTYPAAVNGIYTGIDVQGVCPDGWHVPNSAEWDELANYVSSNGHSGKVAKALISTQGWKEGTNGTDNFLFSAKPTGYRSNVSGTSVIAWVGQWWTSSDSTANVAKTRTLNWSSDELYRDGSDKSKGVTIRCIKD